MSSIYAKVYVKINNEDEKHIRTCGGSLFWVDMCKKECGFEGDQRNRDKFIDDNFHISDKSPGFYMIQVRLELYRKNRNGRKHLKKILRYFTNMTVYSNGNSIGRHYMVSEIPIINLEQKV